MSFYVLAERFGRSVNPRTGGGHDLVELLSFSHAGRDRTAVFLSPLDAAICLHYLNRQSVRGEKNRYELRIHSDPGVVMTITTGISIGLLPTLITGFATEKKTGKLVVQGGCYSMAQMPFLPDDIAWLFGPKSKPKADVVSSAFRSLASFGAEAYQEEINGLDFMEPEVLHKVAAIALAQLGALTSGVGDGLSLYYPSRQAWKKLV